MRVGVKLRGYPGKGPNRLWRSAGQKARPLANGGWRKSAPKPDGGVRKLGIPTVLDRMIQQAVMQVLQHSWDPAFSEHSYGFRPGRSAHQAVEAAQRYIAAGYRWVEDLDLEKFLDPASYCPLVDES
ncbi:MAG: hypothetical protein HYX68_00035 [Planctomycetes bacterium]|nr:hypothetical protein [Planctomycetota bacterium]